MKIIIRTRYGDILVRAHKIVIPGFERFDFFATICPTNIISSKYTITEFRSGATVCSGKSFKEVFTKSVLRLNILGIGEVEKAIDKRIKAYGIANTK